ncbi:MAG: NAD(P) transhydrogenase subunit alpha [Chloroflexales bacterium]|nr:NAD(P) transhydrogenase subunit alpha [Chloroflexales bacterium]
MLVGFTQSATAPPAAPLGAEAPQANPLFDSLYIFILAGFVGFEVIARVSPTLHTPLMSATNAISGISLVGSIVAAGGTYSMLSTILGTVAVAAAAINVVGGFMITDRMLRMFKSKPKGGH